MRAVIVFAHGSRDPLWQTPVQAVADCVRQRDPQTQACCAYLELCEPSLPKAAQQLFDAGATDIRVLPLFLGLGKHARQDLPRLVDELRRQHPTARFTLLPVAGENPRLTQLLADMALESPAP